MKPFSLRAGAVLSILLASPVAWAADPPPPGQDALPFGVRPAAAAPTAATPSQTAIAPSAAPQGNRGVLAGMMLPISPGAGGGMAPQGNSAPPAPSLAPATSAAAGEGRVPLPAVPAVAVVPPAPPATLAQQALIRTGVATALVQPGEANIFPVAAGRVNRIVTPFAQAKISSEASGGIEVRGGVIYITPSSDGPISMFITEDGDESVAISMTLVPSRMPPVHLELRLPPEIKTRLTTQPVLDRVAADRFERGHPYIDMVRALMRALALGRVPPGFTMQTSLPPDTRVPRCPAAPLRVDFSKGQYLAGSSVEVVVGVAANPGTTGVDFTESWCGEPGVLAVALSPSPLIPPGGASEIYIARRIPSPSEARAELRPLLVGGTSHD